MEQELSRVVDVLPGLVWTALADGRADFFNVRWLEYTGLSREQAHDVGWHSAIHSDDRAALLECWRSLPASSETAETETRLRRSNGDFRWFLIRASRLTTGSGCFFKWCVLANDIDDRKQMEESLRENDRRLNLIFDGLPTHVGLSNAECELERVNGNYLEYFGATLAELKRQGRYHNCHPDDRPRALAAQRAAIEAAKPYEIEVRRRRADGVYRWFEVRQVPLRDEDGRVALWYLLQSDIDDRKRAEALLASEKRLFEMLSAGESLPIILDGICRLIEGAARGCGCSLILLDPTGSRFEYAAAPSLPAGFTSSTLGHAANVNSDPCSMAVALGQQIVIEDLASEERWASCAWVAMAMEHGHRACWSTPFSSSAGRVLGAFAIYFDEPASLTTCYQSLIERLTNLASIAVERLQSDALLRRSQQLLADAQQLSRTGSWSWQIATDDITWSDEVYRIFELDSTRAVTFEQFRSRVHHEDAQMLFEILDRARVDGSDFEVEHRLQMPDRSIKYVHTIARGLRDHDGRLEFIGSAQDVTEPRLAEDALGKTRAELARVARITSLGTLTASIAHEVNQPLSGIVTNADTCQLMLAAEPPDIIGANEIARRMIRDANRASEMIARVRALIAKKDPSTEPVDLNEITREVINLSQSELRKGKVILHLALAEGLPEAIGDRVQLQQVILNLLLNAAEAMHGVDERPRVVTITTALDQADAVCLAVRDTGVGFDPRDASQLFEAFYTTKSGGMGIGLSVSLSIIKSHDGRLWAPQNEGPGATFSFSIPCLPQTTEHLTVTMGDPDRGRTTRVRS